MHVRSLLGIGVASILIGSSISSAALVAHYKFDEASGTTAAPTIGSVSGTLAGTSSFVTGGITGNAVSITRSGNGLVNFGNNFNFATGDFSVAFWLKTTTTEADSLAVSKHFAGSENGYFLSVGPTGGGGTTGKTSFVASTTVSNGVTSTTTVNDGVWHQLIGVYTAGGNQSIYVDGAPVEQSKVSAAIINNAIPFMVGGVGALGTGTPESRYTGLIDDLQLYNNALTDTGVQYLFDHPGQTPEPTGLAVSALIAAGVGLKRWRKPAKL